MSEIRSQATPARDELAEAMQRELDPDWRQYHPHHFEEAADVLLADGWSKPRTVNSATELHALPVESVVRNKDGWIGEISIVSGKPVIFWIGNECEDELKDINLPATVLFTPGDAG